MLKYFPQLEFGLRGGKRITISYKGRILPKEKEILLWDSVTKMKYKDAFGCDILQITHPEKGWFGAMTSKIKRPGIRSVGSRIEEGEANRFLLRKASELYSADLPPHKGLLSPSSDHYRNIY